MRGVEQPENKHDERLLEFASEEDVGSSDGSEPVIDMLSLQAIPRQGDESRIDKRPGSDAHRSIKRLELELLH